MYEGACAKETLVRSTGWEKNQVDKNAIYASRADTLYACINEYPKPTDDLVLSRSFDGGDSWTTPMVLDELIGFGGTNGRGFGNCNGFAEGAAGEIHMLWQGVFPDDGAWRFGTVTSSDGGDTWSSTNIDDRRVAPSSSPRPDSAPAPAWPTIATNPRTGDLFVAV